jgi:hypothetical protein
MEENNTMEHLFDALWNTRSKNPTLFSKILEVTTVGTAPFPPPEMLSVLTRDISICLRPGWKKIRTNPDGSVVFSAVHHGARLELVMGRTLKGRFIIQRFEYANRRAN